MNSSKSCDHLSQDLICRTLDDELTTAERFECESHLALCEVCRQKMASLHEFSMEIEAAVRSTVVPSLETSRQDLQKAIESRQSPVTVLQHPGKVMRRFAWGMGIAATLAFAVFFAPKHDLAPQPRTSEATSPVGSAVQLASIEVDGETFMPVPYSNADLPMTTSHIVQMQVPISSLADAGIVLEPVTNRVGTETEAEGSVLADVLVGADGQPRGVHVLEQE